MQGKWHGSSERLLVQLEEEREVVDEVVHARVGARADGVRLVEEGPCADVDVGEELLCSPRRVGKIYAPLAAWYNAPERAALRAKHGPLPLSPDAFRKWPAMNLVTMAFLDDQGVPPAF